jgi:hypothetical protein
MFISNFLDGFDRLVAFDAETTGKGDAPLSEHRHESSVGIRVAGGWPLGFPMGL